MAPTDTHNVGRWEHVEDGVNYIACADLCRAKPDTESHVSFQDFEIVV